MTTAINTAARGLAAGSSEEDHGGSSDDEGDNQGDNEGDNKGGDNSKEDSGGGGWSLAGIMNRAMLVWDDGSQVGVDLVHNPQDSSDFELDGEWELSNGWTLGVNVEFDTYYAGGDTVSQTDWNGDGLTVELPYLLAEIGKDFLGKIIGGLTGDLVQPRDR